MPTYPPEDHYGFPARYSTDAAARLFEFDFHYQVGKFGTATEIPE